MFWIIHVIPPTKTSKHSNLTPSLLAQEYIELMKVPLNQVTTDHRDGKRRISLAKGPKPKTRLSELPEAEAEEDLDEEGDEWVWEKQTAPQNLGCQV